MFNPYRHAGVVTVPSESGLTDKEVGPDALGFGANVTLAGGAYEAIVELDRQRAALYGDLKGMAVSRSMAASVGVLTSVWGVYNSLRPLQGGVTAMSTSDQTRTAQLGGVAGLSYGLYQYFVNPDQESVYAQGYNALTCLAAQARPLLMAAQHPHKAAAASQPTYDGLKSHLTRLAHELTHTSKVVEAMAAGIARAGDAGVPTDVRNNASARDVEQARRALARARRTLQDGNELLSQVDRAGYTIRVRTGLIVGAVNEALRGTVRELDAQATMTRAKGLAETFRDIGKDSADDDEAQAEEDKTSQAETPAVHLGALVPAWQSWLPVSMGLALQMRSTQAVWRMDIDGTGPALRPVADQRRAGPVAAAPPASAASAPVCTPAMKKACQAPVKPKGTAVTPEQLKAELAPLQKLLNEQGVLEAMLALHQNQQKAKLDKLEKELAETKVNAAKALAEEQEKVKKAKLQKIGACVPDDPRHPNQCSRTVLAERVEALYGHRRPVLQALINFRQSTKAVRSIENCNAGLVAVRLVPDKDRTVKPGETVAFHASLSNGRAPAVLVSGGAGTLATEVLGAITKATVKIADDAADGTLELVVSDPVFGTRESVRLTIKKPVSKPTAAQNAAAALAAAAKAAAAAASAAEAAQAAATAAAAVAGATRKDGN